MDDDHINRINHSIVIARTQEGTLLRRISAIELQTIDEEMPIGAYAWQQEFNKMIGGKKLKIIKWCFTVDQGPYTFRHFDFALPVKIDYHGCGFEPGDFGSSQYFPLIGSFCDLSYHEYLYIIPREFVKSEILKDFPSNVLWFFSDNQSPIDSVMYDAGPYLKDYSQFLPKVTENGALNTTYALASDCYDVLTTWDGPTPIEKNKKLEFGKWYKCQYRPPLYKKCCSIVPYLNDPKPVETFVQTFNDGKGDRKLILCRDFVELPHFTQNTFSDTELVVYHPLLHRIFFPVNCAFNQTRAVEICFACVQLEAIILNHWHVVAIGNGLGSMYWLPKLPSHINKVIRKDEFPFIKSLNAMEAEHYASFADNISFDQINIDRANHFNAFSLEYQNLDETKETIVELNDRDSNPHIIELY